MHDLDAFPDHITDALTELSEALAVEAADTGWVPEQEDDVRSRRVYLALGAKGLARLVADGRLEAGSVRAATVTQTCLLYTSRCV